MPRALRMTTYLQQHSIRIRPIYSRNYHDLIRDVLEISDDDMVTHPMEHSQIVSYDWKQAEAGAFHWFRHVNIPQKGAFAFVQVANDLLVASPIPIQFMISWAADFGFSSMEYITRRWEKDFGTEATGPIVYAGWSYDFIGREFETEYLQSQVDHG